MAEMSRIAWAMLVHFVKNKAMMHHNGQRNHALLVVLGKEEWYCNDEQDGAL